MAINNASVVPKVIAAGFLKEYARQRVYAQRVNNAYRSLLNAAGDKVIINKPGAASVGDYTAGGTITYSDADVGTPLEIGMDKVKSWAIKFDDLNAAISKANVLADAVVEHGRVMAETVDADVRAKMVAASTNAGDIALDSSPSNANNEWQVLAKEFSKFHRLMDVQNIPRAGRWLICGPYFAEYLMRQSGRDVTLLASDANQGLINGQLGSFRGFNIYRDSGHNSDYTKTVSGSKAANSARETLIFGTDRATAFLDQIRKTERIRLQTTFADAVRGLYKYGATVIRSNELFRAKATITDIGQ